MSDPKPDELRKADMPIAPLQAFDLPWAHPAIQFLLQVRHFVEYEDNDQDNYLARVEDYLKSQGHL